MRRDVMCRQLETNVYLDCSAIVQLKPETANIVNPVTKDLVVVPASAVAEGTTVSVRPGDKVPCDGVVLEGKSTVDESSLSKFSAIFRYANRAGVALEPMDCL